MSVSVKLPDGRTITVATDDPQEAAKAARRMLARESIQKSGMGGGRTDRGAKPRGLADLVAGHGTPNMLEGIANGIDHFSDRAGSAATFGLTDVADAATNAGITAVKNLGLRATGHQPTYGAAAAYAADRELLKERDADYAKKHPVASTIGSVLGTLGSPVNGPATSFVAKGAPKLAAKAGLFKGLLESTKLPAVAVRSGAAGAGMGAVAGATGADPGQELEGAKRGALAGGMTGAALPVAAAGAGRVLGAAKGAGATIVRATNKATGGKLLDASTTAAKRLTEALKKDGATPEQLKSAMNSWLKTGASSPSLMDVAAKLPSGGANTMRLLTGSAMKGEAAGAAGKYADQVAADLQDNAIARTRALTPDRRTIPQIEGDVEGRITRAATPPPVTPGAGGRRVSDALNSRYDAGKTAVDQAYSAAREAPGEAVLHPQDAGALSRNIKDAMQDFDPLNVPRVAREVGRLTEVVQPGMEGLPPGINPARVQGLMSRPTPIRPLFDARARLTQLASSNDPVEGAAARRVIGALDGSISDAVESGRLSGDPSSVDAWRQAIGQRRQFGQQFEGNDFINKLTERTRHGEGRALDVAGEDASDLLLGRNGVSPRGDMVRDLTRLRETLGHDSPEWSAVQHEATGRLLGRGAGTEQYGQHLNDFMTSHPELADLLVPAAARDAATAARGEIAGAVGDRNSLNLGRSVLNAAPDSYAADVGSGANRGVVQVGAARQIEDMIGRPAEGSSGLLNRLASGTNPGRNLAETFGQAEAGSYQDAIGNEVDRLRNARRIDPRADSQTAPRLEALADLEVPKPPTAGQMIMGLVNKVREGATLTDDERSAIVHLGLAKPEHFIDRWHVDPTPVLDAVKNAGILFAPSTSQETGRAAGQ